MPCHREWDQDPSPVIRAMAFASFVVGALGGAFATHTLSLELDEFSAATNLANYKGAGASSQVSSPPFSLEVRFSEIFWIHCQHVTG